MEKYEKITNLPYNKSNKRPQMSLNDRAAQFAPFAALTGYDDAIKETSRLTAEKINLNQQAKELISGKLNYIIDNKICEIINITYFIPDNKKAGGEYKTINVEIKRIDPVARIVYFKDNTKIEINRIIDLHSSTIDLVFKDFEY